jgi:hypothetical protein
MPPVWEKGSSIVGGRTPAKSTFAKLGFGREKPAPFSLIFPGGEHVNA